MNIHVFGDSARWRKLLITLIPMLAGCYTPGLPHQEGRHLSTPASSVASIPPTVAAAPLLPKPKAAPRTETYSVVVSNLPLTDLLFALGRDAKINIDVHPGVEGNITLNAINQTLPQILERISKQVDIAWSLDDNTLSVGPDLPYLKLYRMDYFGINKAVTSKMALATNVGGTDSADNSSSTVVQTDSQNRFWPQLEAGLCKQVVSYKESRAEARRLLAMEKQRQKLQEAQDKKKFEQQEYMADLREAAKRKGITVTELLWEREKNLKGTSSDKLGSASAGRGLQTSGVFIINEPPSNTNNQAKNNQEGETENKPETIKDLNVTSCGFGTETGAASGGGNAVSLNPETGTVMVNGPKKLHQIVAEYLNTVQASAQRQVMIEATVVEVTLSDEYQAGVDWAGVTNSGKWGSRQSVTQSNINPNGTIGILAYSSGMFSATLSFLEQFGRTKVLSSPKVMALNNQTAVMKVVDEQVYFGLSIEESKNDAGFVTNRTYTSTLHTVPVGLVMQVTPQIGESGVITLNVRPTISRIRDYTEDPAVAMVSASSNLKIKSMVPNLQVREFDSSLKIPSGQMAVLGGLIQDVQSNQRNGIPGLSRLPWIGDLFSYRDDTVKKIELVIFLRPVHIKDGGLENELKDYQQFLPGKNFFTNPLDHDISAIKSGNLPSIGGGSSEKTK